MIIDPYVPKDDFGYYTCVAVNGQQSTNSSVYLESYNSIDINMAKNIQIRISKIPIEIDDDERRIELTCFHCKSLRY